MIVNSIAWIWYWWQFMVAWYCIVFAGIVWFPLPLWKVKTDSWFQSCKALKIDSFAKNHKNNDGHGGLLKDMIVNPEVVLQFAYIWYIKKRWQRWWLVVLNHGKIQWSYNTAARRSCSSLQLYLFTMDRLICYYICALIDNCILNPLSPMQLKYFVHYTDCL